MPTIAIFNSVVDLAAGIKAALERAGFEAVIARPAEIQSGELDLVAYVEEHDPEVIVYDIPFPYPQSLTFLRLLQDTEVTRGRQWVLTTANPTALEELLGPVEAVEVTGRETDAVAVVRAVRQALEVRPRGYKAA